MNRPVRAPRPVRGVGSTATAAEIIPSACDFLEPQQQHSELQDVQNKITSLSAEGRLQEAFLCMNWTADQREEWNHAKILGCLLKGCTKCNAFQEGKQVHALIIENAHDSSIYLGNILVDMYAKSGSLVDASMVFERMPARNTYSWTLLIAAYSNAGLDEQAIECFQKMVCAEGPVDKFICTFVLRSCTSLTAFECGKQVHFMILSSGLEVDIFVESALVDMYAKCSSLSDARQVFDNMKERDVVSWTTIVSAYAQQGLHELALHLFNQMQHEGEKANKVTYLATLKACARPLALEEGKRMHVLILENGVQNHVRVGNALIDMYIKCGGLKDAGQVFDDFSGRDVVSWNTIIAGFSEEGLGKQALMLFFEMQEEGITPDCVTFFGVLKGCAILESMELGSVLHAHVIESALESDNFVQSSLVDMYAKCGSVKDAQKVFDRMDKPDVVSWTALIAAYANEGDGKVALRLFEEMKLKDLKPDVVTFANALKAAGNLGALKHGKGIHAELKCSGFLFDLLVDNALVHMYAKCGSLTDALEVFDGMRVRDVVSWNTIISAFAQQGLGKQALKLFERMKEDGMQPNAATFSCALLACSHAGLVDEGHRLFDAMSKSYGLSPTMDHYACMVDLLCRVGCVDEAEKFVLKMEIKPNLAVWISLLGGCSNHGGLEVGKRAFEQAQKLGLKTAEPYVSLSNILLKAGRLADVAHLKREMDEAGVVKEVGYSWVEVSDQVHTFTGADTCHPHSDEILAELKRLSDLLDEEGHSPGLNLPLDDTGKGEREYGLCEHSERLAVAFGLLALPPGTEVRIMKNHRLCNDCHAAIKAISKIAGREIFARDASCFHHFKSGLCSCKDYW